MKNVNEIKEILDIESRKQISQKLCTKYRDKIPIICVIPKDTITDNKTNYKFVLSSGVDIKCFMKTVKKKVKFKRDIDFFVMTENGQLLKEYNTIGNVSETHKDEDGFLYLYFKTPFC